MLPPLFGLLEDIGFDFATFAGFSPFGYTTFFCYTTSITFGGPISDIS